MISGINAPKNNFKKTVRKLRPSFQSGSDKTKVYTNLCRKESTCMGANVN